jgi:hypothetical protein
MGLTQAAGSALTYRQNSGHPRIHAPAPIIKAARPFSPHHGPLGVTAHPAILVPYPPHEFCQGSSCKGQNSLGHIRLDRLRRKFHKEAKRD